MGLFDELDIAGAADNPWSIPDDTYEAVVSDLVVKKNSKDNMGMTFVYTIRGGDYDGSDVTEYKRLPHSKDAEPLEGKAKSDALSYIKLRLASLGIPESKMNDVTKEDLIGIECYISTKQNGNFTNIRTLSLTKPEGESVGSTTNPFQ